MCIREHVVVHCDPFNSLSNLIGNHPNIGSANAGITTGDSMWVPDRVLWQK